MRWLVASAGFLPFFISSSAGAQVTPAPQRDDTWQTVTAVTVGASAATAVLMPRIFYSDPEMTVGWKSRWHVSVLAPVLTLASLTLMNELAIKPAAKGYRPGCDDTNNGGPHCDSYGMPSSHAFGAFSAVGHGTATWLFDMTKYSGGRFNGASFAGNVIVPFAFAFITALGRGIGNWEDAPQIITGSAVGLGTGFLVGMTYALLQRPECGYTGSMICW